MTVYHDPRSKGYRFDFQYLGVRHRSPRGFPTKREAADAEAAKRTQLRRQVAGLEPLTAPVAPTIQDWAEVYVDFLERRQRVRHLASIEHVLRVVLRFWGRKPARPLETHEAGPYHDLRLLDPILESAWILRFEDWMTARGLSGSRKNQLRSTMSVLYRVALLPAHRKTARVEANPFLGVQRDRVRARQRVLSRDELDRLIAVAPYHLRVAIAVAVYAPKLRLGNILALRFDTHIDRDLTLITVRDHKADAHAPPLVVPIVDELRALLAFAKAHNRSPFVVEWEGSGVSTVKTAVRASVEAAGFVHGRKAEDGVTFHTIRHSIATAITALPGLSERMRAEVMGHSIQTAQRYTHLSARHQTAAHAELAAALPVGRAIVGGTFGGRAATGQAADGPVLLRRVPRRRAVGTSVGRPGAAPADNARQSAEPADRPARRQTRPK